MTNEGEWSRLCRLLDDDVSVEEAVQKALAEGEDPWQALLDGLDEAGALAYLQADDTGMELTDALEQLPRVFAAHPDLGEATDTDELIRATGVADGLLSRNGLRIIRLVEEGDSWPLVVVPADRLEDVVAVATRLGQQARPGT